MVCYTLSLDSLNIEHKNIQSAGGGNLRILLAQGSRSGIARIFERAFPLHFLRRGDPFKAFQRHIDLAAHDQALRRIGECHRQVSQRAEIFRHVLADKPVAARRAADEHTVFIFQRHGQPVDLRLHNIVVCLRNRRIHAFAKGAQLVKGKHVLQTLQRHRMAHLRKRVERISAHTLRRRIRRLILRVRLLQLRQTAHQRVIFKVRDLRRVLDIVQQVVLFNFLAQGRDFVLYIHYDCSTSIYVPGTSPTITVSARRTSVSTSTVLFCHGISTSISTPTCRYS